MRQSRKMRGFTLAELVLVLIILGVVGALVVPSVATITANLLGIGERAELEEQAGLALERMVQELRIADESECLGGEELRLERDSVAISYSVNASALRRQRDGASERLVAPTAGLALSCARGAFGLDSLVGIALTDDSGLELSTHVHLRR